MKALSIKNPWAILIAHGIKDIENRTWRTTHRGRIYIHVSAKSAGAPILLLTDQQIVASKNYSFKDAFIKSAIIGEVDIVDCVKHHPSIWAEHKTVKIKKVNGEMVEIEVPVYNWVLANPVLYDKPIENVKGALSLWYYKQGA